MLNNKRVTTLLFCLLPVLLSISGASTAAKDKAEDTVYDINEFSCKTIMRADDFDQDAAIAFMHGYLVGKSGKTSFDVEKLRQASHAFIDSCLDTPKGKAIDVLADKVK